MRARCLLRPFDGQTLFARRDIRRGATALAAGQDARPVQPALLWTERVWLDGEFLAELLLPAAGRQWATESRLSRRLCLCARHVERCARPLTCRLTGSVGMFVSRMVNAFISPYVGYWSDHVKLSWGRRKPFLLVATPAFAAAFGLIWFPPFEPSSTGNNAFFVCVSLLLNTSFAFVMSPFLALVPEITGHRKSRCVNRGRPTRS